MGSTDKTFVGFRIFISDVVSGFINIIWKKPLVYFGSHMLSFEVSFMDIALLISIIILAILYLSKLSSPQFAPLTEKVATKTVEEKGETKAVKKSVKCPYFLGFLSKNKKVKIPEECFTCVQLSHCLGRGGENEV